jgi:hypothetical protein
MRHEAINTEINTSTWTAISLGSDQTCNTYAAQVRDGTGFKMKKKSGSTAYWTVYGREKIIMEEARGVAGDTLFYAQAIAGTPVLEIVISKG